MILWPSDYSRLHSLVILSICISEWLISDLISNFEILILISKWATRFTMLWILMTQCLRAKEYQNMELLPIFAVGELFIITLCWCFAFFDGLRFADGIQHFCLFLLFLILHESMRSAVRCIWLFPSNSFGLFAYRQCWQWI